MWEVSIQGCIYFSELHPSPPSPTGKENVGKGEKKLAYKITFFILFDTFSKNPLNPPPQKKKTLLFSQIQQTPIT